MADLRWETLHADRLAERPDLVERLLDRTIDGVTIEGVFPSDALPGAIDSLARVTDVRRDVVIGTVIGMPLGNIDAQSTDRRPFFDDSDRARDAYRESFGFDPHERLATVLAPAAAGFERLVPAREGDREYNPGQVRFFDPGKGGLRAHAGNEFRQFQEAGPMSDLVSTTCVTDHLSYFVVLQRPDFGGSLSVFDHVWDGGSPIGSTWEEGVREDAFFDSVARLDIDPDPGSLVLFGGGWRWHRVEPVEGRRQRITYGGFCAPAVDGTTLNFWI